MNLVAAKIEAPNENGVRILIANIEAAQKENLQTSNLMV